ncbi:type I pullulanase [Clostridium guangxiense]|uniref:type I pullulanase n=1 Tax=Clostridium guangxiense TaxID=1662055 RepID=UPI001E32D0B6|nr:type I pullulanase [Clostridium guangxiense]MCD2347732.1 type I pullulanase [Clostridium guangxiense]
MKIFNALVTNFNRIEFKIDNPSELNFYMLNIVNGRNYMKIIEHSISDNTVFLNLENEIDIKMDCLLIYGDIINIKCCYFKLFSSKEFNDRYYYDGKLGVEYTPQKSIFKLWAPSALNVKLLLYKNGDAALNDNPVHSIYLNEENGLWSTPIEGDLKNYYYTYQVVLYNEVNEVTDPYVKATGINGNRGAIIDISETNPENWDKDVSPSTINNFTDAVIYEISIRDISSNPNSNIKNTGKYLGLAEENTKTKNNLSTGLDYIKELGITHVQIMPIFDFSYKSIDEKMPSEYNWGYDPQNYNVPEGTYSTDPYDSKCRIRELKTLISALHKNNISVNVDVVFNHLWNEKENSFEKTFPGYYLRRNQDGTFSNGTGCGNDTASENLMMKKFIIDSVVYLSQEYHIDGFRFDLMGIHDIDAMNQIREAVDRLGRPIMLYGEGWNLNTNLLYEKKAIIQNSFKTPRIGYFNEIIRDSIRGSLFDANSKGFASGGENFENSIKLSSIGCINYSEWLKGPFNSPEQSINYVSCHDNAALYDKLKALNPDDSDGTLMERVKLSLGIILTSQGTAFLECGSEFGRTKNGIDNTYKSPDYINWIDWTLRDKRINCVYYIKNLINLRKNHSAFRFINSDDLKNHLEFINNSPKNSVGFILKNKPNGDSWNNLLIIYNANNHALNFPIPWGNWNVYVNKNSVGESNIRDVKNNYIVEGLSVNVLYN